MTVGEFWDQQDFSYLVTYPFNRGPKMIALEEAAKTLFRKTRQGLLTAPAAQLPDMREQLRRLKRNNDLGMLALTEGLDAFHITATPVALIEKDTPEASALADLLRTPVVDQTHWMCAPVYRDALAFYDEQNGLVGVLNICFECDRMLTDTGKELEADTATYQALHNYLAQAGHPIVES